MTIDEVVIGEPIHHQNGNVFFPYKKTRHEVKAISISQSGYGDYDLNDYPDTDNIFNDFEKIRFYNPGATSMFCKNLALNSDDELLYSDLAADIKKYNLKKSIFITAVFVD